MTAATISPEAVRVLWSVLGAGPRGGQEVVAAAEAAGVSKHDLRRAADASGVLRHEHAWVWTGPPLFVPS